MIKTCNKVPLCLKPAGGEMDPHQQFTHDLINGLAAGVTARIETRNKLQMDKLCSEFDKTYSKANGLKFTLCIEDFSTFWQADCNYCGGAIATIGLDRVDSTKGYEIGNVVPCCKMCNTIKLDHNNDVLNDHMLRMLRHQGVV